MSLKTSAYAVIKRCMDILCSGLFLLLLLPLFIVVCLLICTDNFGSPFFFQQRVGRNGSVFAMVKFRSMVKTAPALGPYWTQDNDPRITRMGRILRATSLDELPQLWNVFRGDMSLVGPRPDVPSQETLYTPEQWIVRHRVRPGITGLAQVNGRSQLSPQERLQYDIAYAANPTLATDISILLKTVRIVIHKIGAN